MHPTMIRHQIAIHESTTESDLVEVYAHTLGLLPLHCPIIDLGPQLSGWGEKAR